MGADRGQPAGQRIIAARAQTSTLSTAARPLVLASNTRGSSNKATWIWSTLANNTLPLLHGS